MMSHVMRAATAVAIALLLALSGCAGKRDTAATHLNRARQLFHQHKLTAAKAEIDRAIQIDPKRTDMYRTAVGLLFDNKLYMDAAKLQTKFLERAKASELDHAFSDNDLAELSVTLAGVYWKAHDYKRTAQLFESALNLYPNSAEVLNDFGYFLADTDIDPHRGLVLTRKAVNLKPDDYFVL